VRRLLPGRQSWQWWEVEFLPLRHEGGAGGFSLLGRVRVLGDEPAGTAPLPERLANLRQRAAGRWTLDTWAASTAPAVRRLVARARLAAGVRAPVLFVGEPGTGKETLARAVHHHGPDAERAFASLDCRRLPAAALAAVLSGGTPGLGAVYLREPAALPRELQLRLCDWAGRPDGPRLLAGTRADPAAEVRDGRLLEDLACLLGTLVIEVPPLRERIDDLPLLAEQMLARACEGRDRKVPAVGSDAWDVLRGHAWPGNLRELYRVLAAAAGRVAAGRATGDWVTAADVPARLRQAHALAAVPGRPAGKSPPLDYLLEQAERRLIELALRRAGGNKTKAAQELGIWRPRLLRRMEALGVRDTEEVAGDRGQETADQEEGAGGEEPS
jgi:DNA-binding NtrC family response regulator